MVLKLIVAPGRRSSFTAAPATCARPTPEELDLQWTPPVSRNALHDRGRKVVLGHRDSGGVSDSRGPQARRRRLRAPAARGLRARIPPSAKEPAMTRFCTTSGWRRRRRFHQELRALLGVRSDLTAREFVRPALSSPLRRSSFLQPGLSEGAPGAKGRTIHRRRRPPPPPASTRRAPPS
jgi:hypothetical protein